MDIYKLKFTQLQSGIFRLVCVKVGSSLNQRQIAKFLSVSPTAVGKALKQLVKYDLLNIKRIGISNLFSIELNRDNDMSIKLKRVENLKMIYESRIDNILEDKFPGCTIILFGSYSRGEDTISSDIDFAIIGSKGKEINLEKFETIFDRSISLHFFQSLKDVRKGLKENICNGIILIGGVEL